MTLRIVYMSNAAFGCPALQALAQDPSVHIVSVYTHPPRPMGRGHKVRCGPIQTLAEHWGLPVATPSSLRSDEEVAYLRDLDPDFIVVAAYGLILPPRVLEVPRWGCINIHASLLPRWRGASPIHHAILEGDALSGISIMRMEAGLDTGPTYGIYPVALTQSDTYQTLHDKLADLGAEKLPPLLAQIPYIQPIPQQEQGVLYAHKISQETARLNWEQTASRLACHVRAFSSSPKAWTTWQDHILKIGEVHVSGDFSSDQPSGTLMTDSFHVVCGQGTVLQVRHLQRADGRMIDAVSFLRGFSIPLGSRLV